MWSKQHLGVFCVVVCALLVRSSNLRAEPETPGKAEFFERFVRAILIEECVDCHGPDEQESNLRLDTAEGLFRGGDSGSVVVPGDASNSRLIQLVRGTSDKQMPPDTRLEADVVAKLEKWVDDGAIWPGYEVTGTVSETETVRPAEFTDEDRSFWSFQPIADIKPPQVDQDEWVGTPVDQFVATGLLRHNIEPGPRASREVLIRRVTYDLTGLPPSPQEIDDFVNDPSINAYETLVDRLLRSPRYGERWGKHWLDVVRYAESAAHDGNNAYLHAWRYRDYVIRSLNEDKPFDQFVIEQLAGDLLEKTGDVQTDFDRMVATGFLQVGPKPVVMRDKRQMLLDIADEQLHTTGVAFLGLTIGCARCHDHKFDPIPTADYYSLAGIFTSTHIMADDAPDSKWLEFEVPAPSGQPAKVMAVKDFPEPANLQIHRRGNYRTLGPEVPRRFLQILTSRRQPPVIAHGSGRLELANWVVTDARFLTARVIVNRLWQNHFGKGIVATSGNFGYQGERPTHPLLLDWLSRKLIDNDWSLKSIHRLILLSSTYQQVYRVEKHAASVDPENRLLWRTRRRRLDAEQFRDSVLAVSNQIDLRMGGTKFVEGYGPVDAKRELFTVDIPDPDEFAAFQFPIRSVYLPVIRNVRPEPLRLFDTANSHESTSVRSETTVAPQSLFLMNSKFVRQASLALANRLLTHFKDPAASFSEFGSDEMWSSRVALAYRLLFGRQPAPTEIARARNFLIAVDAEIDPASIKPTTQPKLNSVTVGFRNRYAEAVRGSSQLIFYQQLKNFQFNGVDQRLELDNQRALNQAQEAITIEYWVKPADVRLAMVIGRDGAVERMWKSGIHPATVNGRNTNVVFHEFFPAEQGLFRMQNAVDHEAPVGEWTHVVFGLGHDKRKLYVNGKLVDQIDVLGNVPTGMQALTIGSRATDSEWFAGQIDHVAVYQAALSDAEVQSHYELLSGTHVTANDFEITKQHYVWAAYCQSLFAMNEFMYVE